jgi:16S rRNA processing protein RimM
VNPAPPPVERVAVGRISRAHGVSGEVSVLVLSQLPERFEPGSSLLLDDAGEGTLTVAAVRPHRQRLLVRFEGVVDRNAAERLTGRYLFVPSASVPPPPEGEYWTHQLVGCEVVTERGAALGRIAEVMHTEANDVWAARDEAGVETLVPALRDVVISVDVGAGRVVVREVPGLTVPETAEAHVPSAPPSEGDPS